MMAGNWKMNLNHLEAIQLVQKLAFTLDPQRLRRRRGGRPPAVHRPAQRADAGRRRPAAPQVRRAGPLAAWFSGAYTGDVGGPMLAKLGCSYVIVGHSERREHHHEDDAVVHAKAVAAFDNGMVPILCVGEGLAVRRVRWSRRARAGPARRERSATWPRTGRRHSSSRTSRSGRSAPVRWPPPTTRRRSAPRSARRLAERYDAALADGVRVLYGGSVKAGNVAGLMAMPDVDGGLVGGASLDAEQFALDLPVPAASRLNQPGGHKGPVTVRRPLKPASWTP